MVKTNIKTNYVAFKNRISNHYYVAVPTVVYEVLNLTSGTTYTYTERDLQSKLLEPNSIVISDTDCEVEFEVSDGIKV